MTSSPSHACDFSRELSGNNSTVLIQAVVLELNVSFQIAKIFFFPARIEK